MEKTLFLDFIQPRKAFIDPSGFLRVPARIGRAGVQQYLLDGKTVNIFREESEVNKASTSFTNVPVTLEHPPNGLLKVDTAAEQIKGFTGNVNYDNGWLVADSLLITHPDAIAAAQTTHPKLSCGYTALLVPEQGAWIDKEGIQGVKGKRYPYSLKQIEIQANHVALCANPRAGDRAELLLDDGDDNQTRVYQVVLADSDNYNIEVFMPDSEQTKDEVKVETLTKEQLMTVVADALRKETQDAEQKQIESQKEGRLAALELENQELKDEIAALKAANEKMITQDSIEASIQARLKLWEQTKAVLVDSIDYSLSEEAIKKLYIAKKAPKLVELVDAKDTAFLDGVFEVLIATPQTTATEDQQIIPRPETINDQVDPVTAAFQKRMEIKP